MEFNYLLLKNTLIDIVKKYKNYTSLYNKNESSVRSQLISPVLQAIGWDCQNPAKVNLEQVDSLGNVADYTLWIKGKQVSIIEAKNSSVPVDDEKVINQLVKYCHHSNIPYGIISNGICWMLYSAFEKKPEDRIIWIIDLLNTQDDYELEMRLLSSLSYQTIKSLDEHISVDKFLYHYLSTPDKIKKFIYDAIKGKIGKNYNSEVIESIQNIVLKKLNQPLNKNKDLVHRQKVKVSDSFSRTKPKKLQVTFPDGTVIKEAKATKTYVKAIKRISVEKIIQARGLQKVRGIPIVSTVKPERQSIEIEKGYWVNTHSSTQVKAENLIQLSERLNLGLKVEVLSDD